MILSLLRVRLHVYVRLLMFACVLPCCVLHCQFEITPFNVMYESLIVNPYMNGTNMTHDLVPCATSGVMHAVEASNTTHTWAAEIALPFPLIGLGAPGLPPLWRINLFRVLMTVDTDDCTPDTCAYGALSPTFVNPPAFHHPEFFGVMALGK